MPRPASLPVPAVVGTATIGGMDGLDLVLTASGQVVVGEPPGMRDQQPDRLGGIDRTAASESDQSVAARVAIAIQTSQNVLLGRVRLDVAEDDRLLSQRADDLRDQPGGDQPRVGHHQGPSDAQPGQLSGKQPAGARAEENASWEM